MNLFIYDTSIRVVEKSDPINFPLFDYIIPKESKFDLDRLRGNILISQPNKIQIHQLILHVLEKLSTPVKLVIVTDEYKSCKEVILSLFIVINAGGGLISKGEKYLLIYRLKKWDFPKGKVEDKETFRDAAVREVEEETGLKISIKDKICTTWHAYQLENKKILKCTKWYAMDCSSDANLAPQVEEGIEKLEWFTKGQFEKKLINSYNSIRFVWLSFLENRTI